MGDNPSLRGLKEDLNIDNLIVLIEQCDTHCELWHFGSRANDSEIVNFYLNHLDILKAFTLYFKDAGADIIAANERDKIQRPPTISEYFKGAELSKANGSFNRNQFYGRLDIGRLSFLHQGKATNLSRRETEILKWCFMGKTAEEVALILEIKPKTVRSHVNNVKVKLGCNKLTDVMRILFESGIIDMVLNTT